MSSTYLSQSYKVEPWPPYEQSQEPSVELLRSTRSLARRVDVHKPLDPPFLRKRREEVINALTSVFERFVADMAVQKGLASSGTEARQYGGQVRISGSCRLGITSEGDDIDAICIAPKHVVNEDFFKSLPALLAKHPYVDSARPIEGARVPLIDLVMRGIPIDLLFCRLDRRSVPRVGLDSASTSSLSGQSEFDPRFDIMDDRVLIGADEASVLSLNGPRCTEQLLMLVPPSRLPVYKHALRALRLWCKRRGMYGNKFGFLGGINLSIMLNYIVQRFPAYSPAGLVLRFFVCFYRWEWPRHFSAQRTIYHRADFTTPVRVWDPETDVRARSDKMPILTPCFPVTNSTVNVNSHTLRRMQAEFLRGVAATFHAVLRLGGGSKAMEQADPSAASEALEKASEAWDVLFRPSEFFLEFPLYIAVHVWADEHAPDLEGDAVAGTGAGASTAEEAPKQTRESPTNAEVRELKNAWSDYVASRMRQLIVIMERDRLPFDLAVPWPKGIDWTMPIGYERTGIFSGGDGRPDSVEWDASEADLDETGSESNAAGKTASETERAGGSESASSPAAVQESTELADATNRESAAGNSKGAGSAVSSRDEETPSSSSSSSSSSSAFSGHGPQPDASYDQVYSSGTAGATDDAAPGASKGRPITTYYIGLRPSSQGASGYPLRFPENLLPDFLQGTLISGYSDFDPRMRASFYLLRDVDLPLAVFDGATSEQVAQDRRAVKYALANMTWLGLPDKAAYAALSRVMKMQSAADAGSGEAGIVYASPAAASFDQDRASRESSSGAQDSVPLYHADAVQASVVAGVKRPRESQAKADLAKGGAAGPGEPATPSTPSGVGPNKEFGTVEVKRPRVSKEAPSPDQMGAGVLQRSTESLGKSPQPLDLTSIGGSKRGGKGKGKKKKSKGKVSVKLLT